MCIRDRASTHADRLATIRALDARGVLVDPHTADGIKVASDLLADGLDAARPIVCLETALPVKFAETIREALGRDVELPAQFAGLESLPRHVIDLDNDVDALKALIVGRLAALPD